MEQNDNIIIPINTYMFDDWYILWSNKEPSSPTWYTNNFLINIESIKKLWNIFRTSRTPSFVAATQSYHQKPTTRPVCMTCVFVWRTPIVCVTFWQPTPGNAPKTESISTGERNHSAVSITRILSYFGISYCRRKIGEQGVSYFLDRFPMMLKWNASKRKS